MSAGPIGGDSPSDRINPDRANADRDGLSQQIAQSRVLVVDDGPSNRALLANYLKLAGFSRITFAADGFEALELVDSFDPDIVVLDVAMPKMDGFEVCRRIRSDPQRSRLPVLIQTAFGGPKERQQAFEAGATDFVTKPIHRGELIARVRLHLENRILIRNLQQYHDRIDKELSLARSMQLGILPTKGALARLSDETGVDIAEHFVSSSELGGDFWGAHALEGGRIAVYAVDFSGHGVTAALNTFRLHTLMLGAGVNDNRPPAELLKDLARQLRALLPRGQFATMFYGVIDPAANLLSYAAAAAPPPLLMERAGAPAQKLESAGLPLGMVSDADYVARTASFPPGATLFLYSDALIETANSAGALFEVNDIAAAMEQAGDAAAAATLERVLTAFQSGRSSHLDDDLTAVVVHRRM